MSDPKPAPTLPTHVINKGTRKWVFGTFEIPPGARPVPVPERLHPRGPKPETHGADDAKDAKFKAILAANIDGETSELISVPTGGAKEDPAAKQAHADEVTVLRGQVEKLQRLVAAGDGAEAIAKLTEANQQLTDRVQDLVAALQAAQNRVADLEKLGQSKKR